MYNSRSEKKIWNLLFLNISQNKLIKGKNQILTFLQLFIFNLSSKIFIFITIICNKLNFSPSTTRPTSTKRSRKHWTNDRWVKMLLREGAGKWGEHQVDEVCPFIKEWRVPHLNISKLHEIQVKMTMLWSWIKFQRWHYST